MNLRRFTDTGEWTTRRYLSLLGSMLIWGIVAIDAWYLWPTSLRGSTSMVIVSGVSMEPTYFTGDLVIARKADPSVGDVIVYAPEGLGGAQIVHRIIGGNATDGWQMQGDNNDFIDPYAPKGDEIKGVVMVHYANFGRVTVLLLNPVVWAFLLMIAIVLLVWWSGDTCEDDQDDDAEGGGQAEDEPLEEDPDLLERVYVRAEDAVLRMAAAGADAGAAALAALSYRSAAPRHAAAMPRQTLPAYLRGSAVVAVLGVVAVFGGSFASASSLTVNTHATPTTLSYAHCANQTLAAAVDGTPSAGSYTSVSLSGIEVACRNVSTTLTVYSAAGVPLATGTATPTTGTALFATGSYIAANVSKVVVTVNGWPFVATWSAPAGTTGISCLPVNGGGKVMTSPGQSCTVNVTGKSVWISYPGAWGVGTPYYHYSFAFDVTSSQNQWELTVDFSNLNDFPLYNAPPVFVGSSYNVVTAPGYACSSLPVFKGRKAVGNVAWSNNGGIYFTTAPGSTNGATPLCN